LLAPQLAFLAGADLAGSRPAGKEGRAAAPSTTAP